MLTALGPRGVLINVARGSVVDQAALITALQAGTVSGAGLDVFEDEPNVPEVLFGMANVVLLPHIGSASQATRAAMGRLVVDNLVAWFNDASAMTPVPETLHLARSPYRVTDEQHSPGCILLDQTTLRVSRLRS